jgi:hypothetical protein
MISISRIVLSSALVVATSFAATLASAAQTVTPNCYNDPHWYCIDSPVVTQARTPINELVVYQGDRIWLRAGGCAQTGGHGATWKRYVNPSGSNSNSLYHGEIQIPGAVESMTFLNQLIGDDGSWSRMWTAGEGNPNFQVGTINIGYTDDDYGDNGYWGHDDGTENQCRGVYNAWLHLYICRADPAHGPTC